MEGWKSNKEWLKAIEINTDPYGKCVIDVARQVMGNLDKLDDDFVFKYGYNPSPDTVDTMISKADDEIGAGGITGAMAGFVVAIVRKFHKKGEEFYLARKDNYQKIKEMEANNIGKLNQD